MTRQPAARAAGRAGRPARALTLLPLLLFTATSARALPRVPGPLGRVDGLLRELAARDAAHGPGEAVRFAREHGLRLRPGGPEAGSGAEPRALVVVETAVSAAGEVGSLQALGADVVQSAGTSASAWVPLSRLALVAAAPRVLRVRRPVSPVWSVTGEGVAITGADLAQQRGFRGQGVKIGVIDVFDGFRGELGAELPPAERVTFRSFIDRGGLGDSDHGVQVAEILADMAPDASLYLAAIDDDVGYRNAVDWLISQGVHVINHSGGFGLFGDLKGSGPLSGKVGDAAANGIFYVEAAGNEGEAHWEGEFVDTNGNRFAEFAPGVERILFEVTGSSMASRDLRVDLSWDDWFPDPADPRPTTDYDLCLYDGAGEELSCSREPQSGDPGQTPYEIVTFLVPSPGQYQIAVRRVSGNGLHFEVTLDPTSSFGFLNVPSSSLIVPADHPDAFAVGATTLGDRIERYSSRGPTNDGRLKPDLVAPDGVLTSEGSFFGTSAAAPHVAGAAALLLSAEPGLSAAALRDRLRSSAVQVSADAIPGPDNTYGHGRLRLDIGGSVPTPAPGQGGRGGGGCRVVPGAAGGGASLLAALGAALAYALWLGRSRA